MIILSPRQIYFPALETADREGLLAVGGDLSVPRLLQAYSSGIFPWTDDPLTWWSPDPRAVFELHQFRPSRRLQDKIRQGLYRITFDTAFEQVMRSCAKSAPGRETTWISKRFIQGYTEMHRLGHAHSVEAWEGDELVGGAYGVGIGGFFAGESMFHRRTDASKIALVALFERLKGAGYALFDTQVLSPLTARLGAIEIRRTEYVQRLKAAVTLPVSF